MSVTSVEKPIRVLIVDDNLQNREVAEGHLVAAGYQAIQAESGEQGLAMLDAVLAAAKTDPLSARATDVLARLEWPGKPGSAAAATPLTPGSRVSLA